PFNKFSDEERDGLRQKLLVAAKMEDDYEAYAHDMEDIEEQINREPPKIEAHALVIPAEERRNRILRQCRAFRAMLTDGATT
ncbi:TraG family conjugative transposon ATPase, partial [Xanthomonas citri pv. citri]|nr:TraG family conjugative transposon ATPase [Xanthomonas citri pv. citri]